MEFSKSLFEIKPFIEEEQEIKFELMERIEALKVDEDCDVAEATDEMDFQLLNQRKVLAQKYLIQGERNMAREKLLIERNGKEQEEREKR